MQIIRKSADKGYLGADLWVPKTAVNVDGLKNSLTITVSKKRGSEGTMFLWRETPHHVIVPREYFEPGDLSDYPIVDMRPQAYPEVRIPSSIQLDVRNPGETIQQDAVNAMQAARGGILQLACVAGDTIVSVNRGGSCRRYSIAEAYRKFHQIGKKTWDPTIPTFTRAAMDGRIGLQQVQDILYRGKRQVHLLELVDGKKLKLTDDHQVLTPTGFRSMREGLVVGDEVIVDGKRTESVRKKKIAYRRIGGFNHHPHARYQSRSTLIEEHRAVVEAAMNGLSLHDFRERCRSGAIQGLEFIDPLKFHVHHRDEDINNNSLSNLEVLPASVHLAKHRPGAGAFGYGIPTRVKIKRITMGGVEDVYDIACADPHHNFVANEIVIHNCGKGKTICALELAHRLSVPTLIVVDTTELVEQWREEINLHLKLEEPIGLIKGTANDWQRPVVITTYHTLSNRSATMPEEIRRWFGLVIFDEGHHLSAETFSKCANLFYGRRIGLTATPERADGTHVVYRAHLGEVLYKNLTQELKPDIYFYQTGVTVDITDPRVSAEVCDINGEIHHGLLAGYMGSDRVRLHMILDEVRKAYDTGRRIIVLSYSVDELINLMALWVGQEAIVADLPTPTPKDVGETVTPIKLDDRQLGRTTESHKAAVKQLHITKNDAKKQEHYKFHLANLQLKLDQHRCAVKIEKEMKKRKLAYVDQLLRETSDAGLLIADVKVPVRRKLLAEKRVVFSIMKYGREALNQPLLDTIMSCEPVNQKGSLQQLMGRVLRKKPGKMKPVVVFFEDSVGMSIGMCRNLRRFLKAWPPEESGPLPYSSVIHKEKQNIWERYT